MKTYRPHSRWLIALLLMAPMLATSPAIGQDESEDQRRADREEMRRRFQEQRARWREMSDEEREAFMEELRVQRDLRRAERDAQRAEQAREALGMTKEEYDVISPMIERVRTLLRERGIAARSSRGSRGDRGRGDRGGERSLTPGEGAAAQRTGPDLSDEGDALRKASEGLRAALGNDDSSSDKIKKAMEEFREARQGMDAAIAEAREELRSVLTARQEAIMIVQGVLD